MHLNKPFYWKMSEPFPSIILKALKTRTDKEKKLQAKFNEFK